MKLLLDLSHCFLQICNKHAPLRRKRVRKQTSPWLTTSIVKMMHERDYVKKKAISSGSKELWEKYKQLRNKVSSTIRQSKKVHLTKSIYDAKKDSKEIWNALRHIVPGKTKNTNITCIKTDVDEYTEPKNIANALNEHFATVGPKLAAKIPGKSKIDHNGCFRM